jgi:hypothetical protein
MTVKQQRDANSLHAQCICIAGMICEVPTEYNHHNNISLFTVTICLFSRKESLWDIAVRMNTEQQDTNPPSGSQPKERTILILGSKGVVSIAFVATRSAPLVKKHNKYNKKVRYNGKAVPVHIMMAYTGVEASLQTFLILVLDAGEWSAVCHGGFIPGTH